MTQTLTLREIEKGSVGRKGKKGKKSKKVEGNLMVGLTVYRLNI